MSFLQDRRGNISVFRVSVFIAIIGGIFLLGGYVSFSLDYSSRQQPLDIERPPDATSFGQTTHSNNWREVYYTMPGGAIDDVVGYYNNQLKSFYGDSGSEYDQDSCVRYPEIDTFFDYDNTLDPLTTPPFYYICMFDRSNFSATQYNKVTIHPGIYNEDVARDTTGETVIIYEQRWQP